MNSLSVTSHRKDGLIEFIKVLLRTPFIMHVSHNKDKRLKDYLGVMDCVSELIAEHRRWENNTGTTVSNPNGNANGMVDTDKAKLAHRNKSRLLRFVPEIGTFHTDLDLKSAFLHYDTMCSISERYRVAPTFDDIRLILNIAQIFAMSGSNTNGDKDPLTGIRSANRIKLATFDADKTIYADGACMDPKSEIVNQLIALLLLGVKVAIVTAAGYMGQPERYEQRLAGLLQGIQADARMTDDVCRGFYVLGGECSFLFQCRRLPRTSRNGSENGEPSRKKPKIQESAIEGIEAVDDVDETDLAVVHLVELPSSQYYTPEMESWTEPQIQRLLDIAHTSLSNSITRLHLSPTISILRKPRAIGLINASPLTPTSPIPITPLRQELLDEIALSLQFDILADPSVQIPFTAFNGGSDVWLDVGSKGIGVQVLQKFLGCKGRETLHVGDQFLIAGNDYAARNACGTLWISSPIETQQMLLLLLSRLGP